LAATVNNVQQILIAEDDEDDFLLFREAVRDYQDRLQLRWVQDGDALMQLLKDAAANLPQLIFLDINMPRRNGFECLSDIRQDPRLKKLPVIIYSTSDDSALVSWMYNSGAHLFLHKPSEFHRLKAAVQRAVDMDWTSRTPYPPMEEFMLG